MTLRRTLVNENFGLTPTFLSPAVGIVHLAHVDAAALGVIWLYICNMQVTIQIPHDALIFNNSSGLFVSHAISESPPVGGNREAIGSIAFQLEKRTNNEY